MAKSDKDSTLLSFLKDADEGNTLVHSDMLLQVAKQVARSEMAFSSRYDTSALGPKSASVAGTNVSKPLAGWFSNTAVTYTGWEN